MSDYNTPDELLLDETFIHWIEKTNVDSEKKWNEWLNVTGNTELAEQAVQWYNAMKIKEQLPSGHVDQAATRFINSMTVLQQPGKKTIPLYAKLSVAAAIAVVFFLGIFYLENQTDPVIKTPYGKIDKQLLPDGTEITLNANSEIKYAKNWKEKEDREVWIKGEGLFHVKHTSTNSRFIVHTKDFDVIVTGTIFNVTNRDDASNVVLKEGSVTIKDKKGEIKQMKPGDFVEYKDSHIISKSVALDTMVAWADKKLIFNKTPLSEVARRIKEYYGVDVYFTNPALQNETVTGMLDNDSLDVLIKLLEGTKEFTIKKENQKLYIQSSNHN